jgi:2-succinyl-5-enolpyruvyl-6-hydroxy-3-cyclohexene-1-carboxylate synthase
MGRPSGAPFTRVHEQRPRVSDRELADQLAHWSAAERGVIVAGPHPEADRLGPALRAFARRSGFVLLADPLSGCRWGVEDIAAPVAADLWLGAEGLDARLAPDLVLRVGAVPTSSRVLGWMERQTTAPQVVIDAGQRWKDSPARATELLRACPIDLFERATSEWPEGSAGAVAARARFSGLWQRLDAAALQAWHAVDEGGGVGRADAESDGILEWQIARAVVEALPSSVPLFVSSSMPVRDVDGFGGRREAPLGVHGNRGASGIDGILSTALGLSAGRAGADRDPRVVALVGDLAFIHDLSGLLATRESDARVVFVVVNNDGGGIFHMLPIARHEPEFTPYFATPHGLDLSRAAALFDVPYRRVSDPTDLRRVLDDHLREMALESVPTDGPGLTGRSGASRSVIIEVCTSRAANRIARDRVRAVARQSVLAALALDS